MKMHANSTRFFYQNGKLVTVNQGLQQRSILRTADVPLAEQHTYKTAETTVLAADEKGSVLMALAGGEKESHGFSAYGYEPYWLTRRTTIGFNAEYLDPITACYVLGNGYRFYSPAFLRFNAADSLSPFDKGGINSYAYCANDPVNASDPSGHLLPMSKLARSLSTSALTKRSGSLQQASAPANSQRPLTWGLLQLQEGRIKLRMHTMELRLSAAKATLEKTKAMKLRTDIGPAKELGPAIDTIASALEWEKKELFRLRIGYFERPNLAGRRYSI